RADWVVVPVLLSTLREISGIRIFLPKDLRTRESRAQIGKNMGEVHRRFPKGLPQLDPVRDMKITDEAFKQLLGKIEILRSRLAAMPIAQDAERLERLFAQYSA